MQPYETVVVPSSVAPLRAPLVSCSLRCCSRCSLFACSLLRRASGRAAAHREGPGRPARRPGRTGVGRAPQRRLGAGLRQAQGRAGRQRPRPVHRPRRDHRHRKRRLPLRHAAAGPHRQPGLHRRRPTSDPAAAAASSPSSLVTADGQDVPARLPSRRDRPTSRPSAPTRTCSTSRSGRGCPAEPRPRRPDQAKSPTTRTDKKGTAPLSPSSTTLPICRIAGSATTRPTSSS